MRRPRRPSSAPAIRINLSRMVKQNRERRALTRRILGGMAWALLLPAAAALCYAVYVEAGGSAAEATARARGCTVCHSLSAIPESLRGRQVGQELRPLLQARLVEVHPLLSRGAEVELADILARRLLPELAAAHAGDPGRRLYAAKCAVCHGRRGEGAPGEYPPLRGSAWITDEPSRLPEILTQGLSERIEVRGEIWDKQMRAPGLSDPQQIEQLIEYLRREM